MRKPGKGIKGAFWASYLSATYVSMAGGEAAIRAGLPGIRIEPLADGGLLVVATDSPLPEDSEESRRRFLAVHRVLQPAFLSRAETSEKQAGAARPFLPRVPLRTRARQLPAPSERLCQRASTSGVAGQRRRRAGSNKRRTGPVCGGLPAGSGSSTVSG